MIILVSIIFGAPSLAQETETEKTVARGLVKQIHCLDQSLDVAAMVANLTVRGGYDLRRDKGCMEFNWFARVAVEGKAAGWRRLTEHYEEVAWEKRRFAGRFEPPV